MDYSQRQGYVADTHRKIVRISRFLNCKIQAGLMMEPQDFILPVW